MDTIKMIYEKSLTLLLTFIKKYQVWLFIVLAGCIGFYIRYQFLFYQSNDYNSFLYPWVIEYRNAPEGALKHLSVAVGDYTPLYNYFIAAISYLPHGEKGLNYLYAIKTLSIVSDYIIAIYLALIVKELTKKDFLMIFAFGIIMVLPTVIYNGAMWGQCDAVFTAFIIMSFYYILKEKPTSAMILFGVAVSLKLQAVFFAPFIVLLFLKKKLSLWNLVTVVIVYLIILIPAVLAGRDLWEMITVYIRQSGQYSQLSLNSPSVYALMFSLFGGTGNNPVDNAISYAGVGIAALVVFMFMYAIGRKKEGFSNQELLKIAMFLTLLMPYLLPHMHERYYFTLDCLAIAFILCFPKKFYVAILIEGASIICYHRYLYGKLFFDGNADVTGRIASLMLLAALIIIGVDLFRSLNNDKSSERTPRKVIELAE